MVDALLLRPLPYPHADRLAAVWLHSPAIGFLRDWPSPGQYIDIQGDWGLDEIIPHEAKAQSLRDPLRLHGRIVGISSTWPVTFRSVPLPKVLYLKRRFRAELSNSSESFGLLFFTARDKINAPTKPLSNAMAFSRASCLPPSIAAANILR
jgi:hypothetical protein